MKGHPMTPRLTRYCVERLDIPESDLRDWTWVTDWDIQIVRCWNGRRFAITGLEVHEWWRTR